MWCTDFVKDPTPDSRPLKFLPIVDEYTRECLALDVARSITATDMIESLRYRFAICGAPTFICSDTPQAAAAVSQSSSDSP